MAAVVAAPLLLYRDIGEVDQRVGQVFERVVQLGEAAEALVAEVGPHWPKRGHKDIEAQVKLPSTHQKWLVKVAADYVRFFDSLAFPTGTKKQKALPFWKALNKQWFWESIFKSAKLLSS